MYIKLSFVFQKVTKVVCQCILVSMLTACVIPVPLQLRIVFNLWPNLIKELGHSSVCGQGGQEIRASRDHIWKDFSRSLGALNTTPWKKISKIFGPA